MTKKIFILVMMTLFSVNMFGGRADKDREFFEDFSVDKGIWTEYDPSSKIDLDYTSDQRLEFNHWIRYQSGYVYRPWSTQDFVLEFDINITHHGGNGKVLGPGFSDTPGTLYETQNGIFCVFYAGWPGGGGVPHLDLMIFENGTQTLSWRQFLDLRISRYKTYYLRLEKTGNAVTYSVFSDAARTNHLSGSPKVFTTTLTNTTFNYFYAVCGSHTKPQGNWEWTSGWLDNIHVRKGQAQVVECLIDIKPQSCPNPVNVKSKGVLPVAVLGSEEFDVTNIDPASIRLEGAAPIRHHVEDVSTPVLNPQADCDCTTEGKDGFADLTVKFDIQQIVGALGQVTDGQVLELTMTGELTDGTQIEGKDCIRIIKKGKK